MHKLYYGDYVTSEDETIKVLKKVRQSTAIGDKVLENVKVVRTCPKCEIFDTIAQERQTMINTTLGIVGSPDLDPPWTPNIPGIPTI